MNYKYITCYKKKGSEIIIYINDGTKYKAKIITKPSKRYYLSIINHWNDILFLKFNIKKEDLIKKINYIYYSGDWPESSTEKGVFVLLNALIKESKKRYYETTEL